MKLLKNILRGYLPDSRTAAALVVALAALLMLPLLSFVEIYNVGEGREGSVVQELIQTGNVILPLRNGEIVPSKPMMFHWLAAVPAMITGDVGTWEIRLPSALAGVATLWMVFWLIAVAAGTRAAIIGAFILLTTEGFVGVSTEGRVDSVFSFFLVAAITVALRGVLAARESGETRINSWYVLLSALACGCAVLTKGPVAWIMVGMIVSGFLILHQGLAGLRQLFRPELLLAVVLPIPWYVAATLQGGDDFLARQLIYENFRRFTGGAGITGRPLWYYPKRIFEFCVPWVFLLPLLAFSLVRRLRASSAPGGTQSATFLFRAGAVWFFAPMLFLSLASGKHPAYLMPFLPGLAIMLALWIDSALVTKETHPVVDRLGVALTWFILFLGPLAIALVPFMQSYLHGHAALISKYFVDALAPRAGTLLFLYVLYAAAIWTLVCTRNQRRGAVAQWGPVIIGVLMLTLGVYVRSGRAVKGWLHGDRPLAQDILAHVSENETLNWVLPRGTDELLGVGRDDSFDTVFFHLNRHVVRLDTGGVWEQPGVYVARKEWVEKQSNAWRARMQVRMEGGKRDDTPKERVLVFDLLPQ